jgi:hypothetical protein
MPTTEDNAVGNTPDIDLLRSEFTRCVYYIRYYVEHYWNDKKQCFIPPRGTLDDQQRRNAYVIEYCLKEWNDFWRKLIITKDGYRCVLDSSKIHHDESAGCCADVISDISWHLSEVVVGGDNEEYEEENRAAGFSLELGPCYGALRRLRDACLKLFERAEWEWNGDPVDRTEWRGYHV